jgi:hypothetical protein
LNLKKLSHLKLPLRPETYVDIQAIYILQPRFIVLFLRKNVKESKYYGLGILNLNSCGFFSLIPDTPSWRLLLHLKRNIFIHSLSSELILMISICGKAHNGIIKLVKAVLFLNELDYNCSD